MKFTDHFSSVALAYAAHRPRYPDELFAWLASISPARGVAWDCGAGSGQASVGLAAHFGRVIATDASAAQIAQAPPHPAVEYRVAPAEDTGLPDESADIVTVAQAAHWFDLPRFFAEARRVVRPGGVVALWTYNLLSSGVPEVDALIGHFYGTTLGPWWSPERRLVDEGYRSIAFPFDERPAPPFEMRARWTLDQVLGYLRTWSAVDRFRRETGRDPVVPLADALRRQWTEPAAPREIVWPLALRVGRVMREPRATAAAPNRA